MECLQKYVAAVMLSATVSVGVQAQTDSMTALLTCTDVAIAGGSTTAAQVFASCSSELTAVLQEYDEAARSGVQQSIAQLVQQYIDKTN